MDYLSNLNPRQREAAVCTEGPVLILAGAGSGKTSTMIHRIAYLIKEKNVSPYNILAVTFTNKAADEMKSRIEQLIGTGMNMWILTFHSACLRILRRHISHLGYTDDFTIYDAADQKAVIKECLEQENLDEKNYAQAMLQKVIGECKDKGISPEKFGETYGYGFREKNIAAIYSRYEKILRKNNALDFDDLLLKTVELFEKNPDILESYHDRFRYIMVDEYQDTNCMQYRFVKLLAKKHRNICVVGDDDQCIYQWRGADIRNILDFEKDFPNAKIIKLEQNYRSCGYILDAAYSVIKNNTGRKSKRLWTENEKGEKIKYYTAYNEKDEALFVAREITRMKSSCGKYSDFAILYRTHAQSRTFEEAFSALDIPYRIIGGLRFYERKEIKDILAYMRLILNTWDDLCLKRVINEPKRGIGDKTLEKLQGVAAVRNESLFDVLRDEEIVESLSSKAAQGVREMVKMILHYNENRDSLKVSDIYDGVLEQSGYLKALENQNTIEAKSRIENLLEFKSVIYDYEENNDMPMLAEFLEKISLMTDIDNHDPDENAVLLMSLHSAKGLEFPVVFMPGMEEGLFPGRRAYESPEGLEEERRLCYVGITRAREKLYLLRSEQRTMYGKTENTRTSKFVEEIDKNLFEEDKKPKRSDFNLNGRNESFSPFEQVKYAKNDRQPALCNFTAGEKLTQELKAGDKVKHKKFGTGIIVSVKAKDSGTSATVVFEQAGMKELMLEFANLEKI